MNLNEMLLLEGKSYENYWEEKVKSNKKIPLSWRKILLDFKIDMQEIDPTATDSSVGNYADWIVRELTRTYNNQNISLNLLLTRMEKSIKAFHKNKKAFKNQDIYKYNLNSLFDEADQMMEEKATKKLKGATPSFEHNGWKIIEIKNHQQACNLGSGTKWCITARDYPEQFQKYKKFGPIFFVVKGNRRWAITGNAKDGFYAWDEQDKSQTENAWKKEFDVPYEVMTYLLRRYNNES